MFCYHNNSVSLVSALTKRPMLSLRNCSTENRVESSLTSNYKDEDRKCRINSQILTLTCSPAKRPALPRTGVKTSPGTTGTEPSPSSVSCTASARRGRRIATTVTPGQGSAGQPPPPAVPSERTTEGPGTASQTSASTSPSPPAPS